MGADAALQFCRKARRAVGGPGSSNSHPLFVRVDLPRKWSAACLAKRLIENNPISITVIVGTGSFAAIGNSV